MADQVSSIDIEMVKQSVLPHNRITIPNGSRAEEIVTTRAVNSEGDDNKLAFNPGHTRELLSIILELINFDDRFLLTYEDTPIRDVVVVLNHDKILNIKTQSTLESVLEQVYGQMNSSLHLIKRDLLDAYPPTVKDVYEKSAQVIKSLILPLYVSFRNKLNDKFVETGLVLEMNESIQEYVADIIRIIDYQVELSLEYPAPVELPAAYN